MMIYREEYRDLFSVSKEYYFAQCISADFGMGAGIAVQFNERFDTKNRLTKIYPNYLNEYKSSGESGDCILQDKVFNLITKECYWNKPTYVSITEALIKMRELCKLGNVKKVAMPLIGSGLDKLNWNTVSTLIKGVFKDMDIEILVCRR